MSIESPQSQSQYPNTFYRVSLKAVIRNERGEVLLNKEGEMDSWSLPGGGWDHGETEHEALARELHEEVGYKGAFAAEPRATQVFWLESRKAWLLWIVYDVKTEHMNFSVGEESTEIAFMSTRTLGEQAIRSEAEQWIVDNL